MLIFACYLYTPDLAPSAITALLSFAMPAEKPRTSRYEVDLEIEKRRRLGLPSDVLQQAGLVPGARVHVQVRRDGRIVITRVSDLLGKYAGAIPGIVNATKLEEQRGEQRGR